MRTRALVCMWLFACGSASAVPDAAVLADASSADVTPPQLETFSPADGAVAVDVLPSITLEFSEPIDPASLVVSLEPAAALLAPSWSYDHTQALILTLAPLATSTAYTVSVTASDLAGLSLSASFSFTTGGPPDTTPPQLVGSTPVDGASDVATSQVVSFTFSEPMASGGVVLTSAPPWDPGPPSWNASETTVTYAAPLAQGTHYGLAIAGTDLAGNLLGKTGISFDTVDGTPPTVTSTVPVAGAMGVAPNSSLQIHFSEAMDHAATEAAFSVVPATACTFVWTGPVLTCTAALAASMLHTVTIGTGAEDTAGNALAAPYVWSFTTGAAPDTTPPAVTGSDPLDDAEGVALDTPICIDFSEPMSPATTVAAFLFSRNRGTYGPATSVTVSASGTRLCADLAADDLIEHGDDVAWRIAATATDAAGNPLPAQANGNYHVIHREVVVVASSPALDGYLRMIGDLVVPIVDLTYLNVGDRPDGSVRGYLSFALPSLPKDSAIVEAKLSAYQFSVVGVPFVQPPPCAPACLMNLGVMKVAGVDYGAALDAADWSSPVDRGSTVVLATTPTYGLKEVFVTSTVQLHRTESVARGGRSQFVVKFDLETELPMSDGEYDYSQLYAGEQAAYAPTLTITYQYP